MKFISLWLALFIVLTLAFAACDNCEKIVYDCNVDDPVQDLTWLKEYVDTLNCVCQITIFQGTYKSQTVFYPLITAPNCDYAFTAVIYNCKGEAIKSYGVNEFEKFQNEVKKDRELYVCNN